MTPSRVRVLLADDHTLVRTGIRRILEGEPGIDVLAEAADGPSALDDGADDRRRRAGARPQHARLDGIDVVRGVKAARPELKVIVLTMHAGREYVARAMKGGADAYLLKDSAVQDLVAVLAAVAGQTYFSPTIQQTWPGCCAAARRARPGRRSPTVNARCSSGWPAACPAKEVAQTLDISVRTVETHRANLMHKLGVKSVAVLIQVAIREGIIEPPSTP